MSKHTAFFSKSLLTGAFCAPLLLAACHSDSGPYPMPSGYAHHSDVYKAPDGPEMTFEDVRQTRAHEMPVPEVESQPPVRAVPAPMVAPQKLDAALWQEPADQLVAGMIDNFGKPNLPVYVTPGRSVEEMELAAALKKSLQSHGVELAAARGVSPFALSYLIIEPMAGNDHRKLVKIILNDYDKKIAEESALFAHIPSSANKHAGSIENGRAEPFASSESRYNAMAREQDEKMNAYDSGESRAMPVPLTSSRDNR